MSEYEEQADAFLKKYKIHLSATFKGVGFRWGGQRPSWDVTLFRQMKGVRDIRWSFSFYGADVRAEPEPKITSYDVLAAISGNHQYRTVDDLYESFGDLDGIDVDAALKEAASMRRFFTKAALRDLCEIQ